MTRVSVVIPTYNRAETLPRAIDSALEQTIDDDLEVIVVDDGSTDGTESVLSAYEEKGVGVVPVAHSTNRGANVARNTGIEHASGEYVAFLDSDDTWHPEKLEHQLEALEGRSDEWVGAYCDTAYDLSGAKGTLRSAVASLLARSDAEPTREGDEQLMAEILADNVQPGAGSTLLVRTDVARAVGGFDETLDRFQDPEFCLRVLERGKLAYVDEVLVRRDETGHPPADVVEEASERYLSAYEAEVERFESEGYEIRSTHRLLLAKRYLAEGRTLHSGRHLAGASVSARHVPGLCWTAAGGIRRRPLPLVATTLLAAAAGLLWWSRLGGPAGAGESDGKDPS
ncbi:glycosyl transferase family 2 [Halobiforma lacisalsi AJ5]|uniref:Family 2 glycosyl transferase n=1 Tax=Natronobacterium lacisalsi AJ5 TaxID=358396 RepID=M0LR02_NATLA|nr:glycosyltransferase family 2 protein [Halobiforma lacisalsi]APW97146.1 glycosyl transferase family 2 [Halobiforma lacisalsi AJ5]EMA34485.1 family 2 glycosyl transferase [Halobiforma lacisalsi AJ5]